MNTLYCLGLLILGLSSSSAVDAGQWDRMGKIPDHADLHVLDTTVFYYDAGIVWGSADAGKSWRQSLSLHSVAPHDMRLIVSGSFMETVDGLALVLAVPYARHIYYVTQDGAEWKRMDSLYVPRITSILPISFALAELKDSTGADRWGLLSRSGPEGIWSCYSFGPVQERDVSWNDPPVFMYDYTTQQFVLFMGEHGMYVLGTQRWGKLPGMELRSPVAVMGKVLGVDDDGWLWSRTL